MMVCLSKSQDDDIMMMCLSKSQGDDIMMVCLSKSQDKHVFLPRRAKGRLTKQRASVVRATSYYVHTQILSKSQDRCGSPNEDFRWPIHQADSPGRTNRSMSLFESFFNENSPKSSTLTLEKWFDKTHRTIRSAIENLRLGGIRWHFPAMTLYSRIVSTFDFTDGSKVRPVSHNDHHGSDGRYWSWFARQSHCTWRIPTTRLDAVWQSPRQP